MPLDLNIQVDTNLSVFMASLVVERPRASHGVNNFAIVRTLADTRYRLTGEFMTKLVELAKSMKMDSDSMIRSCWKRDGETNLQVAAYHLHKLFTKLLDQANEAGPSATKSTDDRLLIDVPDAAAILVRMHFLDGRSTEAEAVAKVFAIPERLEAERKEAELLNWEAGRKSMAPLLRKLNEGPLAMFDKVELHEAFALGGIPKEKLMEQCKSYMQLLGIKDSDLLAVSYSDLLLKKFGE